MQVQSKRVIIIGDKSDEFGFPCRDMLRDPEHELVMTQRNGKELWDAIIEHRPQLVIMDAVMPQYDALNILKKMNKEQIAAGVIVTATAGNRYMEAELVKGGAYCLIKPIDMQYLRDCVYSMLASKTTAAPAGIRKVQANESTANLEMLVTDVIFSVGIPAHIKGYAYLRKAIMLAILHPDMIGSVTKTLYPEVAKAFGTTSSRVERAIRHAIEVAWDRGEVDVLDAYFGYTINNGRGKPTNSEFIAMIADRLRLKNKELLEDNDVILD